MDPQLSLLPNGIRLVHLEVPGRVGHCGVFIKAGARDEIPSRHGIAHFIEHTIFKGTQKRNLFQVLNRLENVGADLNAYTSKEETCIYATFLKEDYSRALELFQDILFHSVFPEKEIAKEKQVVIDEIRSYQDNPAEQILDDFEDLLFKDHPLGHKILGTEKTVSNFRRDDILAFIEEHYCPEAIVIASLGPVSQKRFLEMALRHFGNIPARKRKEEIRSCEPNQPPLVLERKKNNYQVHCVVGTRGYPYNDRRRVQLSLLNNMLGGPVLNSRLSLALRERNGLTYHNESSYTAYSDTGVMMIYFGTDQKYYERALEIVYKELRRLRTERLSEPRLNVIKRQFTGQLTIARESNLGHMMALGKGLLMTNRHEPLEKILQDIQQTTSGDLLEISNEIFEPSNLGLLTFVPARGNTTKT